ncbi:MAG: hypothetical protein RR630_02595 [Coprobacillus sp.]
MNIYNINLNIHYTLPQDIWDRLELLYQDMPEWSGYIDECPQWYGIDGKIIEASIEPSGLQFYAKLPENEWETWITIFKNKASQIVGYEVGEPEEGYEFHYE